MNKPTKESIIEFDKSLNLLGKEEYKNPEIMNALADLRVSIGDIFNMFKTQFKKEMALE
jgi:hypothetical protein